MSYPTTEDKSANAASNTSYDKGDGQGPTIHSETLMNHTRRSVQAWVAVLSCISRIPLQPLRQPTGGRIP